MVEEENKAEQEKPTEDTGKGDKSETTPVIDAASLAAQRLEEANKKQEELLDRQEKLMAKQILGGQAEAGVKSGEKKEKTPEEVANELLEGSGENPLLC